MAAFRERIDLLHLQNLRLREELERETSVLLSLRKCAAVQPPTAKPGTAAPGASTLSTLTRRELEVLQAIVEGQTTKQIADRLGIAFKTAACHRHRIMLKLGVHGTGALVRIAIGSGVVKV